MSDKHGAIDSWHDILGNSYGPGDTVAYASINGKSPQLVVAEVVRINTINSKGEKITSHKYDQNRRQWTESPSVTVTVKPLIDARGFGRYGKKDRLITLQIPENIIAVTEVDMTAIARRLLEVQDQLEQGLT